MSVPAIVRPNGAIRTGCSLMTAALLPLVAAKIYVACFWKHGNSSTVVDDPAMVEPSLSASSLSMPTPFADHHN
jgi:hypothetical protein